MKKMKILLISIFILMSITSMAHASKPVEYASTASYSTSSVGEGEKLIITLTLGDGAFTPVLDASPDFELKSLNGTPVEINKIFTSQSENTYTFEYETTTLDKNQTIKFTPIGNYLGLNPWKFKNFTKVITFSPKSSAPKSDKPNEDTSTVSYSFTHIVKGQKLIIELALSDGAFNPVLDASPNFELKSLDGTPVDLNQTSATRYENTYTFEYVTTTSDRNQTIKFTPIGNYLGQNPWKFENHTETITFEAGYPTADLIDMNKHMPFELTSGIYYDRHEVKNIESLKIKLTLQDLSSDPITDASPQIAIRSFDGKPFALESKLISHTDNEYIFKVSSTNTNLQQNVIIWPYGDYNGTIWSFSNHLSGHIIFRRHIPNYKIDPVASSIIAEKNNITANGEDNTTITMNIRNTNNEIKTNLDTNDMVIHQSYNGVETNSTVSNITNHHDGTYSFTVSSNTPGPVTYSVSITDVLISQKENEATVTFGGGFDFNTCSGSGTFLQSIEAYGGDKEKSVTVGVIPLGIQGLHVTLESDKDIDIRLYGDNDFKIIHWPNGLLSRASLETKTYEDVEVTYSGFNGTNGQRGHEYIEVNGTIPEPFTIKAFGYEAGEAKVNYSWTGKEGCVNEGNFSKEIPTRDIALVGTIPTNIDNLEVNLTSDKDIDIQLYGEDGTAIVKWPSGLLHGAGLQKVEYHGMHIEWSGFNGVNGQKGHEYIKVSPKTTEKLTMKVYGYEAGFADVVYTWGEKSQ